ncbi:MAG: hypothetical protein AAFX79_01610 [Planctomycetota bacterium]
MTARPPRGHVAIVRPWVADAILGGSKTIESRFSRTRREPFGCLEIGEQVYFRVTGGGYVLRASVVDVASYEGLDAAAVADIEANHRAAIGGDDAYWEVARRARFATLAWLGDIHRVSTGPPLHRRPGDRRAWFAPRRGSPAAAG